MAFNDSDHFDTPDSSQYFIKVEEERNEEFSTCDEVNDSYYF